MGEKSHHSGGNPSCVSGVEMLETKAPLKILSGVLSDVQADRRRFRKRRRIERKEEEEEEEKVESEEEAGELEMGNSDVDRKTDEPREFPETKTVGKTVESSKNEENRMEEKERSGDESGGGGRKNDGIEPRVMDDKSNGNGENLIREEEISAERQTTLETKRKKKRFP